MVLAVEDIVDVGNKARSGDFNKLIYGIIKCWLAELRGRA
jgi:hypothetical protein